MMSALTIVKPEAAAAAASACTLAAMVDEIQCLLDTAEMVDEGSADREELEHQLALFRQELPRKVDRTSYALAFLESQVALTASEIKRLQARKKRAERDLERLEQYCCRVIETLPMPKRGSRKLEGSTSTLSISPSEAVVVTDQTEIPVDYFTVTVKMPACDWERIAAAFPELAETAKVALEVRLSDVKDALKAGVEIPGADIEYRSNLRRS